jgi:hypothetical protein
VVQFLTIPKFPEHVCLTACGRRRRQRWGRWISMIAYMSVLVMAAVAVEIVSSFLV